jgi:hypothetical protein
MLDLNDDIDDCADKDNYVNVSNDGDGTLTALIQKGRGQFQLPERMVQIKVSLDWKTLPSCTVG